MILSQFILNDYMNADYLTIISMILVIYSIKRLFIKYLWIRKFVSILLVILCIIVIILSK